MNQFPSFRDPKRPNSVIIKSRYSEIEICKATAVEYVKARESVLNHITRDSDWVRRFYQKIGKRQYLIRSEIVRWCLDIYFEPPVEAKGKSYILWWTELDRALCSLATMTLAQYWSTTQTIPSSGDLIKLRPAFTASPIFFAEMPWQPGGYEQGQNRFLRHKNRPWWRKLLDFVYPSWNIRKLTPKMIDDLINRRR